MGRFFLRDYAGAPFDRFGPAHIALLAVTAVLGALMFVWKPGAAGRRTARFAIAGALAANELAWHSWNLAVGTWSVKFMLPLHLSGVLVWMTPVLLITGNRRLFAISYFAGIPGTLLALLLPELGSYGLPHFRVVSFFIAHILLFLAPLYLIGVEGMRPGGRDAWATWGGLAVYTAAVMGVNELLGSNYLFVSGRPTVAEAPNVLERWPWYVMTQALAALGLMHALNLPFVLRRRKRPDAVESAA